MDEKPDIVEVEHAASPVIAKMIVQALLNNGIPAYVGGGLLQDEFAITQKLLGLQSVNIQVHRDRLEEARKIIEAMREAGKLLEEEEDGEEDR